MINKFKKDINLPIENIIENVINSYHVSSVHSSTVKKCEIFLEGKDHNIVIYEMYNFPNVKFLRNFTSHYIVYLDKLNCFHDNSEINFYSFPIKKTFFSKLNIKLTRINNSQTFYEENFHLKFFGFFKIMKKIIMFLRNVGQKIRFAEDIKLMYLRNEAIKKGHIDKPNCINKKNLSHDLFSK
jgi:hypothetical protein